ncbi:hemagglutinin, partial [Mycoplasmopsis synoviae]
KSNSSINTTNHAKFKPIIKPKTCPKMLALYWDGFMPKIVVPGYEADGNGNNRTQHETTNQQKLQQWFATESNWEKLSEQLTKKLGADKFKNVTLTNPQVSYEEVTVNSNTWKNPKVTFNIQAKPGYQLASGAGTSTTLELKIRVLYTSESSTQNLLTIQGASPTAVPNGANTADHAKTIKDVNVYLNYTGPNIELDAELPQVGNQNNTSLNGTSNVTDEDFNTKFKKLLVSVLNGGHAQSSLFQAIINYVNKFDPKYRAAFVTNSRDGVALTKVQKDRQKKIENLDQEI